MVFVLLGKLSGDFVVHSLHTSPRFAYESRSRIDFPPRLARRRNRPWRAWKRTSSRLFSFLPMHLQWRFYGPHAWFWTSNNAADLLRPNACFQQSIFLHTKPFCFNLAAAQIASAGIIMPFFRWIQFISSDFEEKHLLIEVRTNALLGIGVAFFQWNTIGKNPFSLLD